MQRPSLPLRTSERKTLLILMDLLLVNGSILIALWLWTLRDPRRTLSPEFVLTQVHWFPFLSALWFLLASPNDFHRPQIAANFRSSCLILVRITALMLLAYLVIYFFSPPDSLPRVIVLFYAAISFVLLAFWRAVYAFFLIRAPFRCRAIIVGAGRAGRTIAQAIRENLAPSYQLSGYIDDDPAKQGQVVEGVPIVGTRYDLVPVVKENAISEVILAITHEIHGELVQAIMDCQEQGIQIIPMSVLYEEITDRVPVEHIGHNWSVLLPLDHAATGSLFPMVKRTIDVAIAIVGLLILAILLPFIALALHLDSPGPIFYSQDRVGKGGRLYRLLKLRTMVPDAEAEAGAVWAKEKDPRVTRVGRFLRVTHIDELPQFINIFRGEMSVVGPRPERPEFVAELEKRIPFYRLRHAVRPGMAGWALVKHGYSSSVEDALIKLEYDLYYIKHQSIYLDLLILAKTIGAMISFKGR